MKRLLPALAALLLSACATPALQTESVLKDPGHLPRAAAVPGVEFVEQSRNYCGPATLSMAMGWAGHPVTPDAIADQVYTPGKQGSLQADMLGASRRQGLMAMQVHGMKNLLKEVAAGHPVIVLENLAFTWYPYWHYSVVTGYDLREPELVMHSGSKKDWRYSMRKFERNWRYSDHWALVVLPVGQLSAAASELEHSAAAAAIEQLGMNDKAALAYASILKRWPDSFGALLGMGNLAYARGDFAGSVRFLRRATDHHPRNAAAWHNLATAELAAKQNAAARKAAARAIELAPPDARAAYRESLRSLL
jgi:hypothetical protein